MSNQDPRHGFFAIMWDCKGLESLARLPNPADITYALLKNEKPPEVPNLMHWELRARYNSQRHYEIYTFTATPGIDVEDIREMFATNPQVAADTIRRIGNKIYSDRVNEQEVVIR